MIDKDNIYIKERLFRDQCHCTKDQVFIKDLRIFQGKNIKDIAIVDNSLHSYAFQLRNGIPILPYYKDKFDTELIGLEKYLISLVTSYDIRPLIEEAFLVKDFKKYHSNQLELIKNLFISSSSKN